MGAPLEEQLANIPVAQLVESQTRVLMEAGVLEEVPGEFLSEGRESGEKLCQWRADKLEELGYDGHGEVNKVITELMQDIMAIHKSMEKLQQLCDDPALAYTPNEGPSRTVDKLLKNLKSELSLLRETFVRDEDRKGPPIPPTVQVPDRIRAIATRLRQKVQASEEREIVERRVTTDNPSSAIVDSPWHGKKAVELPSEDVECGSMPEPSPATLTPTGAGETPDDDKDTNRYAPLSTLQPCQRKAYLSFLYAEARNEGRLEDRHAFDWLYENGIDHDEESGELVDYELPSFDTWSRYLRATREATGEHKYTPRRGRETGRSVVKGSEVEQQHADDD